MIRFNAREAMVDALESAEAAGQTISHWKVNQAGEMALALDPTFVNEMPGVALLDRPFFGYPIVFDPLDESREPKIEIVTR